MSKMNCKNCDKMTLHRFDMIRDFADIYCVECGCLNYLMIRGVIKSN